MSDRELIERLIDALEPHIKTYASFNEGYDSMKLDTELIAEARTALAAPVVPEGFALVPIEPTDEMCEAAWESEGTDYVGEHLRIWQIAPAYRAMIAVLQPKEPT